MGGRASKVVQQPESPEVQEIVKQLSPEEIKMLEKRQKISEELVETERTYSTHLNKCIEVG